MQFLVTLEDSIVPRLHNMIKKAVNTILALCAGAVLFGPMPYLAHANQSASTSQKNAITAVRLGTVNVQGQQGLRFVVEMRRRPDARLLLLKSPWRLVIDSPMTEWESSLLPAGELRNPPAISYRFGHPVPDIGRLVLELDAPAAPARAFILPPAQDGSTDFRFVVDLIDGGPTRFAVARQALSKSRFKAEERTDTPVEAVQLKKMVRAPVARNTIPVPASRPARSQATVLQSSAMRAPAATPSEQRLSSLIVAIDAGHGGKDPGAIGKLKTLEKEVTLRAAKMLAEELLKTGYITPILIRDSDRFYKLRTRINRARERQADIFVSLHADSAPNKNARGISVFSLSDTASDQEAAYLARRENKADLIGGPDLEGEDPLAANALLRMFQRESMNESAKFAAIILSNIRDLPGGDKRGHRFAGFAILKSPDIPSVLVEMGFLSNSEDEKNLRNKAYLRGLCKRLARAILQYFEMGRS